jgi:hypothetical protein
MMWPEFTDRAWLWIAASFYLAGFVQGTVSLLRHGRPPGGTTYLFIAGGYLAQLVGLSIRGRAVAGCPLGNPLEIFQFIAWSAITLYLVVGVTFRKSLFGYFTSGLAASLTLLSLAIPVWDHTQRRPIFGLNPWIELHAALAVFSYGVFGLLALTAFMFLLRNYSLKSKRQGGWFSFLPSIMELDHIGVRLLGAGSAILALSLAVGSVYWLKDISSVNVTKLVLTVVVWLIAAGAFTLRLLGLLLAKRFAWVCLSLFIGALLSLAAVDQSRTGGKKTSPASLPARVVLELS